jgi:putative endonuclease
MVIMFFVYVLYSHNDHGLYIGYTADLKRRLSEHERGESKATSYRLPIFLAYYEAYLCHEDAEGRERFLKSGAGRRYLRKQMAHFFALHPLRDHSRK